MSSCARVSLMLLAAWLVWSVAGGALWLGSRLSAASHYLDDVDDWTDLAERPLVRSAIHDLVASGALASLTRETLSRVHLTTLGGDGDGADGDGARADRFPKVQTLGVDVSRSGEATFVYGRFQKALAHVAHSRSGASSEDLGFAPVVVDVGANDGFLSSNSYNLVRWGWSSVLVEPNPEMLALAEAAQSEFVDPGRDGSQTACYVNAAMAGVKTKETLRLKLGEDVVSMESSLDVSRNGVRETESSRDAKLKRLRDLPRARESKPLFSRWSDTRAVGPTEKDPPATHARYVDVEVVPVRDIASRCSLPKAFGVLSVDAEGVGDKVLREFLDAGFRPRWILYESMHNSEPWETTRAYVSSLGWRYLRRIGWNHVFEMEGLFE